MTEEMIKYFAAGFGVGFLIMFLVAWHSLNKLAKDSRGQLDREYKTYIAPKYRTKE